MEAAEKILPHAPDGSFLFNKPFSLPTLETPYGLPTAVRLKDQLGFLETMRTIDLYSHIGHLMGHTTLPFDEGIDTPYCLQQGRVAVGDNELEAFATKTPTFKTSKKPAPRSLILHLGELEGKDLLVSLIFLSSLLR